MGTWASSESYLSPGVPGCPPLGRLQRQRLPNGIVLWWLHGSEHEPDDARQCPRRESVRLHGSTELRYAANTAENSAARIIRGVTSRRTVQRAFISQRSAMSPRTPVKQQDRPASSGGSGPSWVLDRTNAET